MAREFGKAVPPSLPAPFGFLLNVPGVQRMLRKKRRNRGASARRWLAIAVVAGTFNWTFLRSEAAAPTDRLAQVEEIIAGPTQSISPPSAVPTIINANKPALVPTSAAPAATPVVSPAMAPLSAPPAAPATTISATPVTPAVIAPSTTSVVAPTKPADAGKSESEVGLVPPAQSKPNFVEEPDPIRVRLVDEQPQRPDASTKERQDLVTAETKPPQPRQRAEQPTDGSIRCFAGCASRSPVVFDMPVVARPVAIREPATKVAVAPGAVVRNRVDCFAGCYVKGPAPLIEPLMPTFAAATPASHADLTEPFVARPWRRRYRRSVI